MPDIDGARREAAGSRIVVASLFVERVGGGVSLRKIFDDTRALLLGDPELVSRYDTIFYSSLGSGWADAMDECFDWELATESIAYYPAESVPRPENRTPQTVFDVRFRSDLGSVTPFEGRELQRLGGLMAGTSTQNITAPFAVVHLIGLLPAMALLADINRFAVNIAFMEQQRPADFGAKNEHGDPMQEGTLRSTRSIHCVCCRFLTTLATPCLVKHHLIGTHSSSPICLLLQD